MVRWRHTAVFCLLHSPTVLSKNNKNQNCISSFYVTDTLLCNISLGQCCSFQVSTWTAPLLPDYLFKYTYPSSKNFPTLQSIHRIIKSLAMEGTLKDHLVQILYANRDTNTRSDEPHTIWPWMSQGSTTSLGKLCQCLTIPNWAVQQAHSVLLCFSFSHEKKW